MFFWSMTSQNQVITHSPASASSDKTAFAFQFFDTFYALTLLHSERSKLNRVLAVLSAIGLNSSYDA